MLRPSSPDRRPPARLLRRGGFTLVELLMVIVIIGILIALLLPAINAALRSAKRAAVTSEIAQLAQALANFKSKYGDYPPSRFLAVENGNYSSYLGDTTTLAGGTLTDPTSPGTGDITLGQLAQRSVSYLRKFWPRVSTTGAPAGQWYDFNGNGGTGADNPYIMHGHECLVFFLGGIPSVDATGNFGLNGFDKNPTNPFTNNVAGNTMYSANRQPAIFEFNAGRLVLDPFSTVGGVSPGIPGYVDSLGNATPTPPPPVGTIPVVAPATLNFYSYFNAYGNGAYDPNDVNFYNTDITAHPAEPAIWLETDSSGNGPIALAYNTSFPMLGGGNACASVSPNPYTTTVTLAYNATSNTTGPPTVTWQNPQSFQIISSGLDGLYGVGGQYFSNPQSAAVEALPIDHTTTTSPYINTSDPNVRKREQDNLTNFKTGSLE